MSGMKRRATDGLTVNKVIAWVASFLAFAMLSTVTGLISVIFTKQDSDHDKIAIIDSRISSLYEHQKNMDVQLIKLEKKTDDNNSAFNEFRTKEFIPLKVTAFSYWQDSREKAIRNN